jgi:hypothetical protein
MKALVSTIDIRGHFPSFERLLKLFKELSEISLDSIPFSRLNNLHKVAKAVLQQFNNVRGFSLQQHQQNPIQTRDQVMNEIRDAYDNAFEQIAPVVAFAAKKELKLDFIENNARQSVEKLNVLVADQEKARSAMLADMQGTIEKVKQAAQQVGVAQHAIHFKQEADEHKSAATKWLLGTAILILITLIVASISLYNLIEQLPSLDLPKSLQLAVAKLIIFSVLFTGIIWMGRVYRAHRHNYVVNKHRQNALSTFETFAKAANDDQTKSAVLLQTTNCIFSQQHTGYIAQESDTAGSHQILEIIRGISGPQSKPQ